MTNRVSVRGFVRQLRPTRQRRFHPPLQFQHLVQLFPVVGDAPLDNLAHQRTGGVAAPALLENFGDFLERVAQVFCLADKFEPRDVRFPVKFVVVARMASGLEQPAPGVIPDILNGNSAPVGERLRRHRIARNKIVASVSHLSLFTPMKWQGACRAGNTGFSLNLSRILREMTERGREIYTVEKSESEPSSSIGSDSLFSD